jgi:hypothetical protein
VFEGYCPPHYPDMRSAVEAFAERKFGPGGPFHPDTPGPWKESFRVRTSAQVHSEQFKECVALMAQHIFNRFGKFPGTVPSMFVLTYLQAHHLDLEFYDRHFGPGATCIPTLSTCLAGIQRTVRRGKGDQKYSDSQRRRAELSSASTFSCPYSPAWKYLSPRFA